MKKFAPLALALSVVLSFAASNKSDIRDAKDAGKVTATLRANPPMAFAPARITLTAQLKNVSPSDADLYCPTVAWDWGDGTVSESSNDCEPFEPNKSEIQKSFVTQHIYKTGGEYIVKLMLKKAERIVAEASASLNISRAVNEGDDIIR